MPPLPPLHKEDTAERRIEILLEIKGEEEYITRDATVKEFEYLYNAIRNGTQPHKIQRGRGNN